MILAEQHGFSRFTRDALIERAGCSMGLVNHYFGTMHKLQRAVVGEAIRTENLVILRQALVEKHPRVDDLPAELKVRAWAGVAV